MNAEPTNSRNLAAYEGDKRENAALTEGGATETLRSLMASFGISYVRAKRVHAQLVQKMQESPKGIEYLAAKSREAEHRKVCFVRSNVDPALLDLLRGGDLSYAEIARRHGITRQRVSVIARRVSEADKLSPQQ